MSANQLLTREAFFRDIFNASKINTEDVKAFLMYFGGILQLGIDNGLIDQAHRNAIATAITNAIELKTNDDDDEEDYDVNYVQIRNYMYVISSYLQSKSNWDAWQELIKIESQSDAIALMNDARNWLTKKLNPRMAFLTAIKPKVEKLGLSNVTSAHKLLVETMRDFMTCVSVATKFDLQDYHNSVFGIGRYILMHDDSQDSDNFCMKFCDVIYNFCMEVSIMSKINTKELVANKTNEAEGYYNNESKEVEAVNNFYEEKLAKLKERFNKELQSCDDEVDVENKYSEAKLKMEQEWEEKLNNLEKKQAEAEEFQMEILGGDYSLIDLIKEYAVFGLAKKGKIQYPTTMLQRSAVLMRLDEKQAIPEFIELNRETLKDNQVEFLTKIAEG